MHVYSILTLIININFDITYNMVYSNLSLSFHIRIHGVYRVDISLRIPQISEDFMGELIVLYP